METITHLIEFWQGAKTVREHGGTVLLIVAGMGLPLSLWALHRPQPNYKGLDWGMVADLSLILVYAVLLVVATIVWSKQG